MGTSELGNSTGGAGTPNTGTIASRGKRGNPDCGRRGGFTRPGRHTATFFDTPCGGLVETAGTDLDPSLRTR